MKRTIHFTRQEYAPVYYDYYFTEEKFDKLKQDLCNKLHIRTIEDFKNNEIYSKQFEDKTIYRYYWEASREVLVQEISKISYDILCDIIDEEIDDIVVDFYVVKTESKLVDAVDEDGNPYKQYLTLPTKEDFSEYDIHKFFLRDEIIDLIRDCAFDECDPDYGDVYDSNESITTEGGDEK